MLENRPLPLITLSVVSHGQNALVNNLCRDLRTLCERDLHLVLTENTPDTTALPQADMLTDVIVNPRPKGFGANHNAAFRRCGTPFFCVCNPDVRLRADPFPTLLQALTAPSSAVVGPLVRSPGGRIEDSARHFPTAALLLRKLVDDPAGPDYPVDQGPVDVDWIAGMFMLFKSDRFRAIDGFDERYYLYYEDVDLCRRLRTAGYRVVFQPRAEVVHDARRGSRKDPRLLLRHAASALRFLRTKGRSPR